MPEKVGESAKGNQMVRWESVAARRPQPGKGSTYLFGLSGCGIRRSGRRR
jgi:hypothetical protein